MDKCPECGVAINNDEGPFSCAGAEAEERSQNVNLAVVGTQHLISCYCCAVCRVKCEDSWQECKDEEL